MDKKILNGWQDISHYLNTSIRSALRWEKEKGLPVKRHPISKHVFCEIEELNTWQKELEAMQNKSEKEKEQNSIKRVFKWK